MVSGAAGLRAAAAVTIFSVLVMSSQGHHPKTSLPTAHRKRPPLCSDCPSLCNTNCTAIVAADCSSDCGPPPDCDRCKSQVVQGCCQSSSCNSSYGTSSISCCPNDCIGGCDNCTATAVDRCTFACSVHADDAMRCQACRNGAGRQCYTSCISACNKHCVKKGC